MYIRKHIYGSYTKSTAKEDVTLICMVVYLNHRKTEISEMIYKTQSVIVNDISYSDS